MATLKVSLGILPSIPSAFPLVLVVLMGISHLLKESRKSPGFSFLALTFCSIVGGFFLADLSLDHLSEQSHHPAGHRQASCHSLLQEGARVSSSTLLFSVLLLFSFLLTRD